MTNPYPLPAFIRQTNVLVGSGVAVYGPFAEFQIWDVTDIVVLAKAAGDEEFLPVAVTVEKVSNADFDFFTVDFGVAVPDTTQFVVYSRRLHERSAGVMDGTRLDPTALEKELSKQATVLQELRRDVDRSVAVDFYAERAEAAVQDAQDAQQAAEAAAATAAADAAAAAQDAVAAAVEAAEDAADQALANAQSVAFVVVSTRAQLKAVDTTHFVTAYVKDVEDWWDFRAGNFTARVAADVGEGIVVKANAISAAVGAWQRRKYFDYDNRQFSGTISQAISAIETVGGGVLRIGGGVAAPTLPASYGGTVIEYDGPHVDVNWVFTSGDENVVAKRAWKMQHNDTHPDEILTGLHLQSAVAGSTKNGPNSADVLLSLSHVKKNAPSGATVGEIDAQYIVVRQGGPAPTHRNTASDHSGILVDSTSYGNPGHGFAIETALRNLDSAGNVLYQVQTQMGGIDTNWLAFNTDGTLNGNPLGVRYAFGFNAQMAVGQGDVAYLVEGSANWTSAFRVNATEASGVFDIRNTGEFWQGSGANRIKHKHNSGVLNITDYGDNPFVSMSPSLGVIAGNYAVADGLRIQGGALGTQTRLEAIGAGTNINLQVLAKGTGYVMIGRSTNSLGFYGGAGVPKQTGVAVTAAAIHAALVALNLIAP